MIIHPKFIFVHLPKTGGTFLTKFLSKHIPESKELKNDVHRPLYYFKKIEKITFGFIRNPFDWYISLFSANTHGAGPTRPNRAQWFSHKNVRTDPNIFIDYLLNKETVNVPLIDFNIMHKLDIGILTYRFLYSFFDHNIFNLKNIPKNFMDFNLCQNILKFEKGIAEETIKLFKNKKIFIDENNQKILKNSKKVNTSPHQHYSVYYNQRTYNLIKKKDRIIFNLFYRDLL